MEETKLISVTTKRSAFGSAIQGIITHVQHYSLHDGAGIRSLIFLKGCPLTCQWCCNPECQNPHIEVEFFQSKCAKCGACLKACTRKAIDPDLQVKSGFKINRNLCDVCGDCVRVCPGSALRFVGEFVTVDKVLERVKKDRYFYIISKGGITISGGEPLYQFEFTRELLMRSYNASINTAIETCGHAPWKYFEEIIPFLDSVLYDIKHMDPVKHKEWTGVSNELILSNLTKLSKSGVPIIIRLPLIPTFNLNKENITETAKFICRLENVTEVNLMPFHQLGKDKYGRLSRQYPWKRQKALESDAKGAEKIRVIKSSLESYGLKVAIT